MRFAAATPSLRRGRASLETTAPPTCNRAKGRTSMLVLAVTYGHHDFVVGAFPGEHRNPPLIEHHHMLSSGGRHGTVCTPASSA